MCGAAEYMACNAPQRIELSDGRMFWVRAGSKAASCQFTSPNVNGLVNLPAAEVAFQREETGEGRRVLDNTAAIAAGIATNNAAFPNEQTRFPIPTGTGGSTGVAGAGGGNQGSGGAGGAGSGGTGGVGNPVGTGGSFGGTGGQTPADDVGITNGSGCGCATGGSSAGSGATILALAALFGRSLRRRARRGLRA
jgi:MYXO-CTERM domain-containing protein